MTSTTAPEAQARTGRPLRIGIGLAGLQFGGCQINALDLAQELLRRGHEVAAFAVQESPLISVAPLAEQMGIELHVVPAEADLRDQGRRIAEFTAGRQLDVVHVFGAWLAAPTTLALRSSPRTALVVLNWTMDNIRRLPPRTPLVVGTEALREEAAEAAGRAPVWLLEPPVDTRSDQHDDSGRRAFRERWSVDEETRLLVIVSRLDHDMKAEGVAQTIESLRGLADPRLQLAVVGGGDAAEELARLADDVNLALGWRAVFLTGPMQGPGPAYSAADLVLAMGGAALRALAFGKPLVVLGEEGFSKPFTPATLGYFLHNGYYGRGASGDPVATLAEQIVTTSELAQATDLGAWGRQILLDRYSLATVTDRLLTIYDAATRTTSLHGRLVDVAYVTGLRYARQVRQRLRAALPSGRRAGADPASPFADDAARPATTDLEGAAGPATGHDA